LPLFVNTPVFCPARGARRAAPGARRPQRRLFIQEASVVPYNPPGMGLIQIHANLATAVILFNAILGVWGMIKFLRGDSLDGNYLGAIALSPLLGLVQMAVGLVLISMGLGVNVRFVHYLYGALVIISVPAVFAFTRGRDDRGAVLLYAAVLLLTSAFGLRAQMTGYEPLAF